MDERLNFMDKEDTEEDSTGREGAILRATGTNNIIPDYLTREIRENLQFQGLGNEEESTEWPQEAKDDYRRMKNLERLEQKRTAGYVEKERRDRSWPAPHGEDPNDEPLELFEDQKVIVKHD